MAFFQKVYDGTGEGNCLPLRARHSRRLDMVNNPKPVVRHKRPRHSIDWIAIQIALAAGLAIVVLASLAIAIQIGNTLGGVQ